MAVNNSLQLIVLFTLIRKYKDNSRGHCEPSRLRASTY